MVFSNPVFLFLFLPLTLLFYVLSPRSLKNLVLLGASLFFYAWGEELYVLILIASIAMNYVAGLLIDRAGERRSRLWFLWLGCRGSATVSSKPPRSCVYS